MWLEFFACFLAAIVALFFPGFLFLKGIGASSASAFSIAPAISVCGYGAYSILFSYMAITASFYSLLLAAALTAIALACLFRLVGLSYDECGERSCAEKKKRNVELYCYLFFGLLATCVIFIKNLDGPGSYYQAYDNFNHLGTVRSFLADGDFSPFATLYPLSDDPNPFIGGASFYPSAWHAVVAMVTSLTEGSIPVAINAVNSALIAVVFPSAMHLLISRLFGQRRPIVLCGAVVCVAVAACPWDYVIFGPLYPNFLSMALVPIGITAFISLTQRADSVSKRFRIIQGFLFIMCCGAIALSQPNGIFTMAVFLAPYLVFQAYSIGGASLRGASRARSVVYAFVTALGIILIWLLLYSLPLFSSVVDFNWPATVSTWQAIVDVVTFGLPFSPANLILMVLCAIGIARLLHAPSDCWLVTPYLFSAFSYIICVSTEGALKHLLTGFWYTDPHRIASLVGLCSIPILAYGASAIFELLTCRFRQRNQNAAGHFGATSLIAPFLLVTFVFLMLPSFELRGLFSIETPFGYLSKTVSAQNNVHAAKVLTLEEEEFAAKALESVPENAVIINSPNDGSAFLYSLYGANVLYRQFALPSIDSEKSESVLLRRDLFDYSTSASVREAVDSFGASYVLLLDQGEDSGENRQRFWSYYPDQWVGIERISDETPGFSVVVSQDDMRLYKIDKSTD